MKRQRNTGIVLIIAFVALLFGIAGTIIGIFGEGWWIQKFDGNTFEKGILRYCNHPKGKDQECGYIDNVFKFSNLEFEDMNGDHRDIVLLCLCVGGCFASIALFPFFLSACMMVKTWECVTLLNTLFISLSAVSCISGMVYTEFKFKNTWTSTDSDRTKCWSYIVAWIGAGFLLVSSIFSFISVFMKPRETYTVSNVSSPTGARSKRLPLAFTRSPTSPQSRSNSGYEKDDLNKPIQNYYVKKGKFNPIPESTL